MSYSISLSLSILSDLFLLAFYCCQLLSHVWLFVTPWTAACQASLSIYLPGFAQVCVHLVGDAIHPSRLPWGHKELDTTDWLRTHTSFATLFCFCLQSFPASSLVAQTVKRLPTMQETRVWPLGQEDPLEKEMATHSSTLAWEVPWMEEPGGLQSMGSQRVRHDWVTSLSQCQGLFQWVGCLYQVTKVLELSFSISPSNQSFF